VNKQSVGGSGQTEARKQAVAEVYKAKVYKQSGNRSHKAKLYKQTARQKRANSRWAELCKPSAGEFGMSTHSRHNKSSIAHLGWPETLNGLPLTTGLPPFGRRKGSLVRYSAKMPQPLGSASCKGVWTCTRIPFSVTGKGAVPERSGRGRQEPEVGSGLAGGRCEASRTTPKRCSGGGTWPRRNTSPCGSTRAESACDERHHGAWRAVARRV
jgi:hypothetical protein